MGVTEIMEIDEGVEGEERDVGVVGQVMEEEEEVVLEEEEFILGSGEIEEKEEGKGRGRRGRRVLDGAVSGEEFGWEIGVGDGTGKGVATETEGAVPDA